MAIQLKIDYDIQKCGAMVNIDIIKPSVTADCRISCHYRRRVQDRKSGRALSSGGLEAKIHQTLQFVHRNAELYDFKIVKITVKYIGRLPANGGCLKPGYKEPY